MMASAEVRWLSCRNPNAIMRTMCKKYTILLVRLRRNKIITVVQLRATGIFLHVSILKRSVVLAGRPLIRAPCLERWKKLSRRREASSDMCDMWHDARSHENPKRSRGTAPDATAHKNITLENPKHPLLR